MFPLSYMVSCPSLHCPDYLVRYTIKYTVFSTNSQTVERFFTP
jgi:hypothetical protein